MFSKVQCRSYTFFYEQVSNDPCRATPSVPSNSPQGDLLNENPGTKALPGQSEYTHLPAITKNISNILLNSRGEVLLDKEPISIRDLRSVIIEKMSANDKLIFSVKTHPKAKYQSYVEVLDQLKMANATRISIAETN